MPPKRVVTLDSLSVSDATRKLNPGVFPDSSAMNPGGYSEPIGLSEGKKRLRQDSRPVMNKLETAYYNDVLRFNYSVDQIKVQAVRLELARGIWYKADFFLPHLKHFFEVKGPRAFRGGFENLKVAARVHNWAGFSLVWLDENGGWNEQQILP